MKYTDEEKIFCVNSYLESKSYTKVKAKFRQNTTFQQNHSFSNGLKVSSNWITSQQQDKAYNPQNGQNTVRIPENITAARDSVGRLRSPCSDVLPAQRWPSVACFMNKSYCRCSITLLICCFLHNC